METAGIDGRVVDGDGDVGVAVAAVIDFVFVFLFCGTVCARGVGEGAHGFRVRNGGVCVVRGDC